MSRSFSRVKSLRTSTASSSNNHGTRYDDQPCSRLCEDSSPKASHRLNSAGDGVPSKPPMSWLQNPKPDIPRLRPPRSDSAIDSYVASQSPPQCTGKLWL